MIDQSFRISMKIWLKLESMSESMEIWRIGSLRSQNMLSLTSPINHLLCHPYLQVVTLPVHLDSPVDHLFRHHLKYQSASIFPSGSIFPSIAAIKQVELFTNWRPFVPEEFKDRICPEPTKEVIDKVKMDKRTKAKRKAEAKLKAVTTADNGEKEGLSAVTTADNGEKEGLSAVTTAADNGEKEGLSK